VGCKHPGLFHGFGDFVNFRKLFKTETCEIAAGFEGFPERMFP
jgi:hypothetical protein